MRVKLFDAELKIMEILWKNSEASAKQIADILGKEIGWSKSTTYTMIKRCVDKGAISRNDPGFICRPTVTAEEAREYKLDELVNQMYGGAVDRLIASILQSKKLSYDEIERLKQIVITLEQ